MADIIPFPDRRAETDYPIHRPADVLPKVKDLASMVAWDTETSGLFTDDGGRTATVSVAFTTKSAPAVIQGFAFPFDQGRAEEKGFEPVCNAKGELRVLVGSNPIPNFVLEDWMRSDQNLGREHWDYLMRWLSKAGKKVGLVAHNGKFDSHMTRVGTREWPGVDLIDYMAWDTMVAQSKLEPRESVALKTTAARHWGDVEAEEAREVRDALVTIKRLFGLIADDGPRYDLLPWNVVGPYATQDAVLTLRLARKQTDDLEYGAASDGSWGRVLSAIELTRTLYRIERRGFGDLDIDTCESFSKEIETRIAELEDSMPFQPPTAYKAKEYFFDVLGLRPWKGGEEPRNISILKNANKDGSDRKKVHKQGSLSIDIMKRMATADVPHAGDFAELTRLRTSNSMHYRGFLNLVGEDQRIRTNFKQVFVKTGRMSVERFQAQNIPRRDSTIFELNGRRAPHPRDLFLVPEGRRRVNIDLSQAELRVAASFSGCAGLLEKIREGRDIHAETATQIYGVQPDEPGFKNYRTIAKRSVFGGIFLIGPKSLREDVFKNAGLEISLNEAKKVVYGFREMYPEIEQRYNECQDFAADEGYIPLVDGSRSYFASHEEPHSAWSRQVQSSLALFNAAWLNYTEKVSRQYDALVLSVHDSVVLDLPEEAADEVSQLVVDWVGREFPRWFNVQGNADVDEF